MKNRVRAAGRYVRTWAPFWGRCILAGLSIGSVLGAVLATTVYGAVGLTPLGVVLLNGSIAYLRATRGRRALMVSIAAADARGIST